MFQLAQARSLPLRHPPGHHHQGQHLALCTQQSVSLIGPHHIQSPLTELVRSSILLNLLAVARSAIFTNKGLRGPWFFQPGRCEAKQ